MTIKIINNTTFKYISLLYGEVEYDVSNNCVINIETSDSAIIKLVIKDKNQVFLDLIDLFFGILNPENSICKIKCLHVFELISPVEHCNLVLSDLTYRTNNNIIYESVFVDTETANIETVKFELSNVRSAKKKYTFLQLLVSSLLPLNLLLIIFCAIKFSWSILLLIFLNLFIFTIPAVKRIVSFNKNCTQEKAEMLLTELNTQKRSGTPEAYTQETKLDKFFFRIFDCIFKKK